MPNILRNWLVFRYSHDRRTVVFRKTALLTAGKIIGDAAVALLLILIARNFGSAPLGEYGIALSIASLYLAVGEFGFGEYAIREIARHQEIARQLTGTLLSFKTLLITGLLVSMFTVWPGLGWNPGLFQVLVPLALYWALIYLNDSLRAVLHAHQQMHLSAILEAVHKLCILVVGATLMVYGADFATVCIAFPVGGAVLLGGSALCVTLGYGFPDLRPRRWVIETAIRPSLHFLGTLLLFQVQSRIDVIVLGWLSSPSETGFYMAAQRLIVAVGFIPFFLANALYPQLSHLAVGGTSEAVKHAARTLRLYLKGAILVAFAGFLGSRVLITSLYGNAFQPSIQTFELLMLLLPALGVEYVAGVTLAALDRQRTRMVIAGVGLAVTMLGLPFLTQQGGGPGTALAMVMGHYVGAGLMWGAVFRWEATESITRFSFVTLIFTVLLATAAFQHGLVRVLLVVAGGMVYLTTMRYKLVPNRN